MWGFNRKTCYHALQIVIRYTTLFWAIMSAELLFTHPISESSVFTLTPRNFTCGTGCFVCPTDLTFVTAYAKIPVLISPLYMFDLFLSSLIMYIVATVHTHDNRQTVIKKLLAISLGKCACMLIFIAEMSVVGGGSTTTLLYYVLTKSCVLAKGQKKPAFFLIIRFLSFCINCLATICIGLSAISNKFLAKYHNPIKENEENDADKEVLMERIDEENIYDNVIEEYNV